MYELKPTRIMVADDHPLVRQGLAFALKSTPDLVLVSEVPNGLEAVRACRKINPDVIVMDLQMPVMDGIEAIEIIHSLYPHIRIVAVTSFDCDRALQERACAVGASACLDKQTSLNDFIQHLRTVVAIPTEQTKGIIEVTHHNPLSHDVKE